MAFTNTSSRFASLAVSSLLPEEIIDNIWYIIDNNLKGVFVLESVINFELLNNDGYLGILFSQNGSYDKMIFDFDSVFDDSWPPTLHAIDRMGKESIILPAEL